MGPPSYLPSGLPETIGPNILLYCIGDRGSTENTEWDTLQFVKVGSPMDRLTKMGAENPHLRAIRAKRRQNHTFSGLGTSGLYFTES